VIDLSTGIICLPPCPEGALHRLELTHKDIELALNRSRLEESALREALHRLQTVNDGLSQDKGELVRSLGQVRLVRLFRIDSIIIQYDQTIYQHF